MARRVLSIIGLVHMVAFSVLFVIFLINPSFAWIVYALVYTGVIGLGISVYFYIDKKMKQKDEVLEKQLEQIEKQGEQGFDSTKSDSSQPTEADQNQDQNSSQNDEQNQSNDK